MKWQPHHSKKLLVLLTSALPLPVMITLQVMPAIAASGQAGMGAQTAAQSSAASSAASNAAAAPATTPAQAPSGNAPSFAPQQMTPTQSMLPNSSSSNQSVPGQNAASSPAQVTGTPESNSSAAPLPNAALPVNTGAVAAINGASAGGKSNTAGSAKTSGASGGPQLRGLVNTPAESMQRGTVESFFQFPAFTVPPVGQTRDGTKAHNLMADTRQKEGLPSRSPHGALWHMMDNIGIPVPTANDYEALDPTLRRNYVDPQTPDINSHAGRVRGEHPLIRFRREQATVPPVETPRPSAPAPTAINMQKIPASELEGLDFSAKTDEQKQK